MVDVLLVNSVVLNGGDAAITQGSVRFLESLRGVDSVHVHVYLCETSAKYYPNLPMSSSLNDATEKQAPKFFWRIPALDRFKSWTWRPLRGIRGLLPWISPAEHRSLLELEKADVVVSIGGSYLTDAYDYRTALLTPRLSKHLGQKTILLGASLGPFYSEANARMFAEELKLFDAIIVRDRRSYDLAISLGYPADRCILGNDLAFFLNPPVTRKQLAGRPRKIGVSLRQWVYPGEADPERAYDSYLDNMAASLDALVEGFGVEITMISTCQGIPEYTFHDDKVALAVRERMQHKDAATVDRAFRQPEEFVARLGDFDLFIGTRMHACILSLLSGCPTINIEYEFKSRELFAQFDLSDYVIPIDALSAGEVCGKFELLVRNYDTVSAKIARGLERVQSNFAELSRKVSADVLGVPRE